MPPTFGELLAAFGRHAVQYLVIGGYAVTIHAKPRYTKDLDVWVRSGSVNLTRACKALRDFGAPPFIVEALKGAKAGETIWMGKIPFRVDFILSLKGMSFAAAWRRRVRHVFGGVPVWVIDRKDLIASKIIANRPQDQIDVRSLERAVRGDAVMRRRLRKEGSAH